MGCLQSRGLAFGPAVSSFSGLPVADVLTLTSGDRLVKQPNDVIAREVEVTHRLRRGIVVTGDDCIAIETDEVFLFRAHRRSLQVRPALTQTRRGSLIRQTGDNEAPTARCRNCLREVSFLNLPSPHSITSSAMVIVGGTSRPRALIVL